VQVVERRVGVLFGAVMTTRWEEWFSEGNLRDDPRILAAPHSHSVENAAAAFLSRGTRRILDLACGVGRDTLHLAGRGLSVIGVDAALNGLRIAKDRHAKRGLGSGFAAADARCLPFRDRSFDGVYCFGLLHEFAGERKGRDVAEVMAEIERVLPAGGLLVLTVLAGDPEAGLPAVQLFTREMFDQATNGWRPVEVRPCDDIGCTNRPDYHIWYGVFEK
jgi:ubiquinone/menaquinone biosynthesis C-methylase UbiE